MPRRLPYGLLQAPEIMQGQRATIASDIYSFGLVMLEVGDKSAFDEADPTAGASQEPMSASLQATPVVGLHAPLLAVTPVCHLPALGEHEGCPSACSSSPGSCRGAVFHPSR